MLRADLRQVGVPGVGERRDESDRRRRHPHHRDRNDVPRGLASPGEPVVGLRGPRAVVGFVRCHVCLTSVVGGGPALVPCSTPKPPFSPGPVRSGVLHLTKYAGWKRQPPGSTPRSPAV
ncbi:hypothetical protein F8144_19585 [Streptomyces triticiradicis]|uniref:Uncharacterized protein n=1 Tax=Streptomyces triticiradicis TaxID=2651189 RepID=A0A7J5DE02_9ACTN|nr:hypothetical protein F8144_19585 [Streptomyces triticiradicis]